MQPYNFYDFPDGDLDSPTKFSIYGIPWDANSTHHKGSARSAPRKLRELTSFLGRLTELEENIEEFDASDFGDVQIFSSLPDETRKNIQIMVEEQIPWGQNPTIPIMIGGDHYCSYPAVKALNSVYNTKYNQKFGFLVFDAHLDYYDKWLDKESDFHCTVTKRIADLPNISSENIAICGVRDMDIPELEIIKEEKVYYVPAYKFAFEKNLIENIENIITHFSSIGITNLYISIDIDVLEGCYAPGSGYAIPGGLSYRTLWYILCEIVRKFNIVGIDLVEIAPDLDLPSNLTQLTGVKLITELMGFITMKEKGVFNNA